MTLYEKRSKNMTLLVPYIPLAPKIPIESGSNSNLEPPPPVRTSDRYAIRQHRARGAKGNYITAPLRG